MRHVLVVDDDPGVRKSLARELYGELVRLADGRDQALMALLGGARVDAVVSDLDLGSGRDGIEVLRAAWRYHPDSARVLVSASSGVAVDEALATGVAHAYVPKPWPAGRILETVRTARDRRIVLLAESDEGERETLRGILAEHHAVCLVRDGVEALESLREARPDAVVAAQALPRLSGLTLAWAIANDDRYRGLPVILILDGGHEAARDTDAPMWVRALVRGKLARPVDRRELLRQLERRAEEPGVRAAEGERDDRRLVPRVDVAFPGLLTAGARAEVTVVTLSPCGALLESDVALDPGTRASLAFDVDGKSFEGECRVLYGMKRSGRRGLGVKFEELSAWQQATLIHALGQGRPRALLPS